ENLAKVEGSASLEIKVVDDKVEYARFKAADFKRFFTNAMQGKPIAAIPQHLARICGTCSNAHILCAIEACEHALGIRPSAQTILLRYLTSYGLMIRDHALHLYLFVMPDIYGKDNFLDFDENKPEEHQLLHDAFNIKAAGNFLSTLIAGRSVHALYPTIGGFLHFPEKESVREAIKKLEEIRPAVLRLIKIFEELPWRLDRKTNYMALVPERFGFLNGQIKSSRGEIISEDDFRSHLERVVLPYSQASAYKHEQESYMVGALARINLAKELLHPGTKESAKTALAIFPSTNIYHNNLAQAIEILHSVDDAIEILSDHEFVSEPIITKPPQEAVGIGVIEAPRGTLYHKVELGSDGLVKGGEVIVPTGQNQVNMEEDIARLVGDLLPTKSKEEIQFEIEKLIRAYDPCISCATHFLKVKWQEE
ncbi:MAG: nickel-dependent hydrogenase large subunit, partial [bacterium]|nr:nickel-dependent hydrogenase large subunit [bacterium]